MGADICPKCKRRVNNFWYYCPMCGEKLKEEIRKEEIKNGTNS
jgi:predicted amidophosphoribosyltransferase